MARPKHGHARRREKPFSCIHCGQHVDLSPSGTRYRNHCPHCLWSIHVDERPGDRRSPCRSAMAPIAIEVREDGEWAVVHRCTACRAIKTNRIAGDDDPLALLQLALRPLAQPPFPLDMLARASSRGCERQSAAREM